MHIFFPNIISRSYGIMFQKRKQTITCITKYNKFNQGVFKANGNSFGNNLDGL